MLISKRTLTTFLASIEQMDASSISVVRELRPLIVLPSTSGMQIQRRSGGDFGLAAFIMLAAMFFFMIYFFQKIAQDTDDIYEMLENHGLRVPKKSSMQLRPRDMTSFTSGAHSPQYTIVNARAGLPHEYTKTETPASGGVTSFLSILKLLKRSGVM